MEIGQSQAMELIPKPFSICRNHQGVQRHETNFNNRGLKRSLCYIFVFHSCAVFYQGTAFCSFFWSPLFWIAISCFNISQHEKLNSTSCLQTPSVSKYLTAVHNAVGKFSWLLIGWFSLILGSDWSIDVSLRALLLQSSADCCSVNEFLSFTHRKVDIKHGIQP